MKMGIRPASDLSTGYQQSSFKALAGWPVYGKIMIRSDDRGTVWEKEKR